MQASRASASALLKKTICTFFYSKAHPLNLAVLRLVVFYWLLKLTVSTDFRHFARIPTNLRVPPAGYGLFFDLIPMEEAWISSARSLAVVFCFLALVGLFTRTCAFLGFVFALYLLGLPEFFGKIDHTNHHLLWFAGILAASRSGDALSVDAVVAAWKRADCGNTKPPGPARAYALPLRFVWLLIGVIYFFPGLAKLLAGPHWFLGDNLKYLMYDYWSAKGFLPAWRVDRYPFLYRASGLAIILFEISFIFFLFLPKLRFIAIVAGLVFHRLTGVFLHIYFRELATCYVAFFDWYAIFRRLGRLLYAKEMYLVYDGSRRVSRRLIAFSRLLDVFGRTRYLDARDERAMREEGLPQGDLSALSHGVYALVDNQQLTGAKAYRSLAARIPLLLPVLPLFFLFPKTSRSRHRMDRPERIFSRPSPHPLTVDPQPEPRFSGVVIVGSLFLFLNAYCGVRKLDSWPFAVYPQFSEILEEAKQTSLEIIVQSPTGQTRLVQPYLRWTAVQRIVHTHDHAERAKRLQALQQLLRQDGLDLQPGDSLQFYQVTRSTIPEESQSNLLHRELLLEFHYEPS